MVSKDNRKKVLENYSKIKVERESPPCFLFTDQWQNLLWRLRLKIFLGRALGTEMFLPIASLWKESRHSIQQSNTVHPQESENAMADFQTRNYRKVRKKRLNLQLFQYVRQAKEGSGESVNVVILFQLDCERSQLF